MQIFIRIPTKLSNYLSAKNAAKRLGITSRRLRLLANQGRVSDAFRHEQKGWLFPKAGLTITPGKRGPALTIKQTPAAIVIGYAAQETHAQGA